MQMCLLGTIWQRLLIRSTLAAPLQQNSLFAYSETHHAGLFLAPGSGSRLKLHEREPENAVTERKQQR